jgi:lipopolysaccharide biosynthesis regulator YciM
MKAFCPSCNETREVKDLTERCPHCHRAVIGGPESAPPASNKRRNIAIAGVAIVAVGAGIAYWSCGACCSKKPEATAAKTVPVGESLAARLGKAGLTGEAAVPPGTPDEAMQKVVAGLKDGPALANYVKTLVAPGKLQLQPTTQRRGHPAQSSAKLFAEVVAGTARPVHAVEAAFLVAALAQAHGDTATFLTDAGGIQSPLLLSKTRVAVKLGDGTVIEPFATGAMLKPQPIPLDQVAAWWLVLRAHAERMTFEFKAANADMAAADVIWPNHAIVEFARGVAQLDQGLIDQGLPACEAALAKEDDALARLSLVQMALQLDQPVKAWTLAEQVLNAHPDLPEAHLAVGVLNLQRAVTAPDAQKPGLFAEAKKQLELAKQQDPKVVGVNAALAQLMMQQKDVDGAEKLLQEAAGQKDPDAALLWSEILRGKGKPEEALKALQDSGATVDDERVAVAIAQNQMVLKKSEDALATVDAALKANPASRQLMMVRAELLRGAGKLEEAAVALAPLTQAGPDAERARLLQAQLYLQNHTVDKALAILEPAHKAKPADKETLMLLLIAYAIGEKGEEADKLAADAIAQKTLTTMDVAGVWLQVQQPERAQKLLEGLMEATVPEPEQVALLAMLYTATGQKDQAIKLRDLMAKKAGEKGAAIKEAVDKGLSAAEAEMARQKAKQDAVNAPGPGAVGAAPGGAN